MCRNYAAIVRAVDTSQSNMFTSLREKDFADPKCAFAMYRKRRHTSGKAYKFDRCICMYSEIFCYQSSFKFQSVVVPAVFLVNNSDDSPSIFSLVFFQTPFLLESGLQQFIIESFDWHRLEKYKNSNFLNKGKNLSIYLNLFPIPSRISLHLRKTFKNILEYI